MIFKILSQNIVRKKCAFLTKNAQFFSKNGAFFLTPISMKICENRQNSEQNIDTPCNSNEACQSQFVSGHTTEAGFRSKERGSTD
jgi:hypothetical protein